MADIRPSPGALGLAPLILRVVLGLTFVWAGSWKWWGTAPVSGEDAAYLANLGVLDRPVKAAAPEGVPPVTPLPASKPTTRGGEGGGMLTLAQVGAGGGGAASPPVGAATAFTAEDFPEPVQCRGVWMIALGVHKAAHPVAPAGRLWPVWMGEGLWPKVLAMGVLIAEFWGGALVLIGLFTRLGATAIAGTMLGAMWLTQIGPAVQSGHALLGFLPAKDWLDMMSCQTLLWQAALLAMGGALMLLGSGALAIDRAIGGYRVVRQKEGAKAER